MSLYFDGINQKGTVSDTPVLTGMSALAVSLWLKAHSSQLTIYPLPLSKDINDSYQFQIDRDGYQPGNSGGEIAFRVETASASKTIYSTTNVMDDSWHHLVGTWDGTKVRIYVDTAKENEGDLSGGTVKDTVADLIFAAYSGGNYYKGELGDIRIYNRPFTIEEIKILCESRGSDNIVNGLIGRWLMIEKPDGTAAAGANSIIDISKEGNHGTPSNSPIYRASPIKLIRPMVIG